MKKMVRIYGTDELMRAFKEMNQFKLQGYGGTMSFCRGKKTADIKIKIEYKK